MTFDKIPGAANEHQRYQDLAMAVWADALKNLRRPADKAQCEYENVYWDSARAK
jgi:hypothetical protein